MYLANVAWEIFPKKLGLGQFQLEAVAALLGLALLICGGASWVVAGIAGAALVALEAANRRLARRLVQGPFDRTLILTLEGPFVSRRPFYDPWRLLCRSAFRVGTGRFKSFPRPTCFGLNVRLDAPADWRNSGRWSDSLGSFLPANC